MCRNITVLISVLLLLFRKLKKLWALLASVSLVIILTLIPIITGCAGKSTPECVRVTRQPSLLPQPIEHYLESTPLCL
jgi:hypothetical protein